MTKSRNETNQPQRQRSPVLHFSLRHAMIGAMFASLLLYHYREPLRAAFIPPLISDVTTSAEFAETVNAEQCVLFVAVDWSVWSTSAEQNFETYARSSRNDPAFDSVQFARINVTDMNSQASQAFGKYFRNNATCAAKCRHAMGGYGAVLWLSQGKVIDCTTRLGNDGETFQQRTTNAFTN